MNTQQSQHTPTPWTLIRVLPREDAASGVLNILAQDVPLLAIADRNAQDEADAAFIVTACNAYDANQSELASNQRTIA